jgi:hypothetical protein
MTTDDTTPAPWLDENTTRDEADALSLDLLTAELDAALDAGFDADLDASRLAVWIAGGVSPEEAEANLTAPMSLARLAVARDFLEAASQMVEAPSQALSAVLRARLRGADVVALRRPSPASPAVNTDTFLLLAAASDVDDPTIVCRSQSGLWTLEVFTGQSPEDRAVGRGSLLLRVHGEHAAGYEGRSTKIFVMIDGAERILAEDVVRGGELYAPVSLKGLDLRRRDAVSVVFDGGEQGS